MNFFWFADEMSIQVVIIVVSAAQLISETSALRNCAQYENQTRSDQKCRKGHKLIYYFVAHHLLWSLRKERIERLTNKRKC